MRRKVVSVSDYKRFRDGWSEDVLVGLLVRNGSIVDARLGDLFEDGSFYDKDGARVLVSHIMTLRKKDIRVNGSAVFFRDVFVPTRDQVLELKRIVKKIPENKLLKDLLNGIRKNV